MIQMFEQEKFKKRKRARDFQNATDISLQNSYVYFAVSKAANSTIKYRLSEVEYYPINAKPVTKYNVHEKRCLPLLSPYQLTESLKKEAFYSDNFFRFGVVRNPYSRLLSCYLDRIQLSHVIPTKELIQAMKKRGYKEGEICEENGTTPSFDGFIRVICEQTSPQQNSHWRRQFDDLLVGDVDLHFIGKFENLWNDMATVSEKIFGKVLPEMTNPNQNNSPKITQAGSKVKDFYTPELIDLVKDAYHNDFETFGYSKNINDVV